MAGSAEHSCRQLLVRWCCKLATGSLCCGACFAMMCCRHFFVLQTLWRLWGECGTCGACQAIASCAGQLPVVVSAHHLVMRVTAVLAHGSWAFLACRCVPVLRWLTFITPNANELLAIAAAVRQQAPTLSNSSSSSSAVPAVPEQVCCPQQLLAQLVPAAATLLLQGEPSSAIHSSAVTSQPHLFAFHAWSEC